MNKIPYKREQGFSLISTIFILVVLASLGGYIAKISSVQHMTSALSVQSTRAWFAVRSGLEWVAYQINSSGCPAVPTTIAVENFTVILNQCDSVNILEGADHFTLYNVSLTASVGTFGSVDFVSRDISATIAGP